MALGAGTDFLNIIILWLLLAKIEIKAKHFLFFSQASTTPEFKCFRIFGEHISPINT
jgi:hypothetical protein